MRKLLSCTLLLCLALSARAEYTGDLRQSLMQALSQQPLRHFRFVQEKKLAMLGKPLITEGELQLGIDQTVTWDIRKPYQLRYVITQDRIREIDDKGERVLMTGQNPLATALNQAMTATFSGQWQEAEAVAAVTVSGNPDDWQLHVTPLTTELQGLIASITVSGHQNQIDSVVIAEQNGDSATIRLFPLAP